MYEFHGAITRLFTSDAAIVAAADAAAPAMVLSIPPYALMMTCVGVLRGLGRPKRGALAVGLASPPRYY